MQLVYLYPQCFASIIKYSAEQRADNHLAGGKSFAGYGKDYMKMPEYGKSIVKYR
jgi:hypothetical protein